MADAGRKRVRGHSREEGGAGKRSGGRRRGGGAPGAKRARGGGGGRDIGSMRGRAGFLLMADTGNAIVACKDLMNLVEETLEARPRLVPQKEAAEARSSFAAEMEAELATARRLVRVVPYPVRGLEVVAVAQEAESKAWDVVGITASILLGRTAAATPAPPRPPPPSRRIHRIVPLQRIVAPYLDAVLAAIADLSAGVLDAQSRPRRWALAASLRGSCPPLTNQQVCSAIEMAVPARHPHTSVPSADLPAAAMPHYILLVEGLLAAVGVSLIPAWLFADTDGLRVFPRGAHPDPGEGRGEDGGDGGEDDGGEDGGEEEDGGEDGGSGEEEDDEEDKGDEEEGEEDGEKGETQGVDEERREEGEEK
jgi:hypothetical protein